MCLGGFGHPEGNDDIEKVVGKSGLIDALREKQAFADETGAQSYIATQFLFESAPVATWAETLRAEGINMGSRFVATQEERRNASYQDHCASGFGS